MAGQADRIEVYTERCMGAGNCAEVAPRYFDQSDTDGTVVVLRDVVDEGDAAEVHQAVDICPVQALALAATNA